MTTQRSLNNKLNMTGNIMARKYMTSKQARKQELAEDSIQVAHNHVEHTGEEGDEYGIASSLRKQAVLARMEIAAKVATNAMKKKASDDEFTSKLNDCYQEIEKSLYDNEAEKEEHDQFEKDQIVSVATRVGEMEYDEFVEPKNVQKTQKPKSEKKKSKRTPVPKEFIGFSTGEKVVSGDVILGSKEKIESLLTKTQMCRHVNRPGGCRIMETCRFAHSVKELRKIQCAFGSNCRKRDCSFCRKTENTPSTQSNVVAMHQTTSGSYSYEYTPSRTQDRMITTEDTTFEETFSKYKTTLCTFYQEKGYCPRKVCNFAHGKQELRCGYGSSCRNEECTRNHVKKAVKVFKRQIVEPIVLNPETSRFGDFIDETGEIILLKSAPQTRNPDGTLSFLGALLKPAPVKPVRPRVVKQVEKEEKVEEVLEEKFEAPIPPMVIEEPTFEKTFEDDVQIIEAKPVIMTKNVEADIPKSAARNVLSLEKKNLLARKNAEKRLAKKQAEQKPVVKKNVEEKTEKIEKPQEETQKIEKLKENKIKIEYVCNDSWDD